MAITTTHEYMARENRRFIDQPILSVELPDGYYLHADVHYITNIGKERIITIPRGMYTDLASVPQVARSLVSKDGPNRWGAILHDYLYKLAGGEPYLISRKDADLIFMEAMHDLEVRRWKRNTMYWAVRAAGWKPWREHKHGQF